MSYSVISSTGSYLPERVLTNDELSEMVDTSDEWIMQRVGIRERRIVKGSQDSTNSMAEQAARRALESAGLEPDDVDLIIVGTASADYYFPSTACDLQNRLGMTKHCPAFDINVACAGFVYALNVADMFIRSGQAKHALVVGVDTLSAVVDWTDRNTCVLFGDGAGAVILSESDEPGLISTNLHAAGGYSKALYSKSGMWSEDQKPVLHMDGREVFKVAVTKLDEIVDQTLEKAGMQKSDIDWLIPHQANMRIIKAVAKRLELPMERVILTIERHGNTSAASVPLALDEGVRSGQVKRGQMLMLEAFGAGLAWGSALVKY